MPIAVKNVAQVAEEIRRQTVDVKWLHDRPMSAAYTMIVGAGFSYPGIGLTRQLLREEIGDFYCLQDAEGATSRSRRQKERDSAQFWREFNSELPEGMRVALDRDGLPIDVPAAYRALFDAQVTNPDFYASFPDGGAFLKEFQRHVLNPAWGALNAAHFYLACLLELQQWGALRTCRPFCRRIFTTNFDTLLQQALQTVNVLYTITDRPASGFSAEDFVEDEEAIHLVYTHGSVVRHNPANTDVEIVRLRDLNARVLEPWLERHGVIVVGYSGWNDGLMDALAACNGFAGGLYWCDVHSGEEAEAKLAPEVVRLLQGPGDRFYVPLPEGGANHFMCALYEALAPEPRIPELLRDPLAVLERRLMRLNFAGASAAAGLDPWLLALAQVRAARIKKV